MIATNIQLHVYSASYYYLPSYLSKYDHIGIYSFNICVIYKSYTTFYPYLRNDAWTTGGMRYFTYLMFIVAGYHWTQWRCRFRATTSIHSLVCPSLWPVLLRYCTLRTLNLYHILDSDIQISFTETVAAFAYLYNEIFTKEQYSSLKHNCNMWMV